MEHLSNILSTVAVTVVTALFIYIWNSSKDIANIKSDTKDLLDLRKKIEELLTLKTKLDILYGFWEKEVFAAIAVVHKPHEDSKKLDDLLDKFKILVGRFGEQNLKDDELIELVTLLESILSNVEIQPGERLAAGKILSYIEMRYKMMQLGV